MYDLKGDVLKALKELKSNPPPDPSLCKHENDRRGICDLVHDQYNVILYYEYNDVLKLFYPHFESWEHFSGDKDYPIPGGWNAYLGSPTPRWSKEQRRYRLHLLDHLIECIQKEIDDEKRNEQ